MLLSFDVVPSSSHVLLRAIVYNIDEDETAV